LNGEPAAVTFDLETRHAHLSVGELAEFALGPRESAGGAAGLWRAQLGTHWHRELRAQAKAEGQDAVFEVPISGEVRHRGWTVRLTGRIDQSVRRDGGTLLREIKTVTQPLPAPESVLRQDYPDYFVQLAAYAALRRSPPAGSGAATAHPADGGELIFVEVDSGLAQTVALTEADDAEYRARLDRLVEFLELRQGALARRRALQFRAPFGALRPGQETVGAELAAAVRSGRSAILLEAPTGFGKTGVLLQLALGELRDGRFDRVIYLTGKSTGQLQVVRTLAAMMAPGSDLPAGAPVEAWQVRNKGEHCVNSVFHCVKDACGYLAGMELRWPHSGLARFYLNPGEPRDLASLKAAGLAARICPYEITRAALAFNDLWVGDFNYVFSPDSRSLFYERPGFAPARTLLLIDEAHNLASRAADAHSHTLAAAEAQAVVDALHQVRAPAWLILRWEGWTRWLQELAPIGALPESAVDDVRDQLQRLGDEVASAGLDYAALGPHVAQQLWRIPAVVEQLERIALPRLWWCPRAGELALTCLDAGPAIGAALREFGGVVLATATPGPTEAFAAGCGLAEPPAAPPPAASPAPDRLGDLTQRDTRRLFAQVARGRDLLAAEAARESAALAVIQAHTPWRVGAYAVAVDLRVDTTFQQRARHHPLTAATVAALAAASGAGRAAAVFFPSYAYAEAIARALAGGWPELPVALQPRQRDLSAQAAWVESSLTEAGALFLVLGSSFAESIDLLGGRVTHAMVVGPALPEVNPVQRAKLAELQELGRDAAFDRVYRIPGMQKVNQALGRLVRAPGQRAAVLLHCRRFAEPGYARLLAEDYQSGRRIESDRELSHWLANPG
jgi:Rad3-related DNA helicase